MGLLERRLAEFVDREAEMQLFCDMLETGSKSILVVWGDSGLGKSSLLAKMIHECAQRRVAKAEVTWTKTRPYDYLGVMRKIRDDVLSSLHNTPQPSGSLLPFTRFTDLANYFTVEHYELTVRVEGVSSIHVAQQATIQGSTTGDIGGIIVKDVMLNSARSDMAVPEAERMARLTDRFLEDLRGVVGRERLVVFFDAVEEISADTEKWVWGELLCAARNGRLENTVFVLCGEKKPELDRDWDYAVETAELRPLSHEHIVDYLARRGVEESQREALALMLEATTQGRIAQIATNVDAFLKLQAQRKR
ncbi:MAG TPA: ATP-binding protein [Thermoanaerobaculia bacterium]|jgi:GTPase SAR1 family protein